MIWQYNPFVWLPIGVLLITAALAVNSWRQRHLSSHRLGFVAACFSMVWALTYALQLSSADLGSALFWMAAQMLGPLILPLFWFVVTFGICFPQARLSPWTIALIAVMPATSATLLYLPGMGGPMVTDGWMATVQGIEVLHILPGPFFRVHLAYTYGLITAVIVILVWRARSLAPLQRRRASMMLIAAMIAVVANMLFAVGWLTWQRLQPATVIAMAGQLVFLWGITSTHMIDIRPIARERVIEAMRDGLLMFDQERRLVDISPSAAAILSLDAATVVGDSADHALARWPAMAAVCKKAAATVVEIEMPPVEPSASPRWIEAGIEPLFDRLGRQLGCIALLRDITAHKLAEQAQEHLIAELKDALAEVKTLQGLLPVCAWCGKIRDDDGHWSSLDHYVASHYNASVTHGICPDCAVRFGQASDKLSGEERGR